VLGYIAFAVENPALFRLMFGSQRPDFNGERLAQAARSAFEDLVALAAKATGNPDPPDKDHTAVVDVAGVWGSLMVWRTCSRQEDSPCCIICRRQYEIKSFSNLWSAWWSLSNRHESLFEEQARARQKTC
jgi:hypothetical protein